MHYYSNGLTATRFLKALAVGGGDRQAALGYAKARDDWGADREHVLQHLKASVPGLSTSTGSGSYVPTDLLAALRPLTVFGRLPLRPLPARMPYLTQTGPARAYWVGQSKAAKMTVGRYTRDHEGLVLKRVAAISVATLEQIQDPSIEAEQALLADLLGACREALDRSFLDRTNVGSADTPASVTSGVTPIPSTGFVVADLDADFAMAVRQLNDAGSDLRNAYWVMPSYFAARLSLTRGTDGGLAYPGVGALGGTLAGLPVITSASAESEPNSDDLSDVVLLDASQISIAEGPAELHTSTEAMIEMSDAPTGASDTPVAASVNRVSMFQSETVALKASLRVTWKVRRAGMVQVIANIPSVLES